MDPINPVGFACRHHSSAQVFSVGILGYSTISDLRAAGKDAVDQVVLLKYQQIRFLVRGQSLDIYGPGIISDQVSDPVGEAIVATLVQIRTLVGDAEQIVARYGLERSGDTTPVEFPNSGSRGRQTSKLGPEGPDELFSCTPYALGNS